MKRAFNAVYNISQYMHLTQKTLQCSYSLMLIYELFLRSPVILLKIFMSYHDIVVIYVEIKNYYFVLSVLLMWKID